MLKHLIIFIISVAAMIYFGWVIYDNLVVEPQRQAQADREYEAEKAALYREYCSIPGQAAYDPQNC